MLLLLCVWGNSAAFSQFNYIHKLDHSAGEYVHALAKGEAGATVVLYQNSSVSSGLLVMDSLGNQVSNAVLPGIFTEIMVATNGDFFALNPDQGNFNLARFNSSGAIFWHKSFSVFGSLPSDVTADVTPQGDIVIAGTGVDFFGFQQIKVVKVDGVNGNILWGKTSSTGPVIKVRATRNGGCLLVHRALGPSADNGEFHVLDGQGNVVWTKKLSGLDGTLLDAVETVDGDFVALVDSNGFQPNGRNPKFLLRMDSVGNFLFGVELADTAIGVSVSGYFFNSLEATPQNGAVLSGQRQSGDIVVLFQPVLFWMGETPGLSFGLECIEQNIPSQNFPISSQAIGLGEPGNGYFGYAFNTEETFSSNSETFLGRRQSIQVSSCGDCIVKFRSFQANDLVSVSRTYGNISVTEQSVPWSPSPNAQGTSSVCYECEEQVFGGFFSQPNPDTTFFTSTMTNADSLVWDFGDGNTGLGSMIAYSYSIPGSYTVCLTGYGTCDTLDTCQVISVPVGIENGFNIEPVVYPIPAQNLIYIAGRLEKGTSLKLLDLCGKVISHKELVAETNRIDMSVEGIPNGMYLLEVTEGRKRFVKRVEVIHQ